MSDAVELRGLTWKRDLDGEYNEYTTEYKGHKLTVSSNKDGNSWDYSIDFSDLVRSDASTLQQAMRAVMDDVDSL